MKIPSTAGLFTRGEKNYGWGTDYNSRLYFFQKTAILFTGLFWLSISMMQAQTLPVQVENHQQQAWLINEKARQQAAMDQLCIQDLNKDLARQKRTHDLLVVSLGLLISMVMVIMWYNRWLHRKNTRLVEKNQELEEILYHRHTFEQKQISPELHDNLNSLLVAIKRSISALNPDNLTIQEKKIHRSVLEIIEYACNEVGYISPGTVPSALEKEGLASVLENMIQNINQTEPLTFTLNTTDLTMPLDKTTAFNLYAICLELTHHIVKHSGATQASVQFRKYMRELHLFISDNGRELQNQAGSSLRNIHQRAEVIGATIETQSAEDGTIFWLTLPLTENNILSN